MYLVAFERGGILFIGKLKKVVLFPTIIFTLLLCVLIPFLSDLKIARAQESLKPVTLNYTPEIKGDKYNVILNWNNPNLQYSDIDPDGGSMFYQIYRDGARIDALQDVKQKNYSYTNSLTKQEIDSSHTFSVTVYVTKTSGTGGSTSSPPSNTVTVNPSDFQISTGTDPATNENSDGDNSFGGGQSGGETGGTGEWDKGTEKVNKECETLLPGTAGQIITTFLNPIKGVICALIKLIDDVAAKIINRLIKSVGSSESKEFQKDGEYYNWIIGPWKIVLGIANVFVVIVLLFLAIVNIAHINYDTYAIKKSLPYLIVGIIMANFSLLIGRMINDASEILTITFTGGDPYNKIFKPLITAIGFNFTATPTGQIALLVFNIFTGGVGTLILVLIFGLIALIALLILIFLLYIRLAVMIFLFVVAPVAFVGLAFPPTQGLFKQWWSNFMRWVFMKPIIFLVLYLAAIIGSSGKADLTIWMITVALTYFAFVVPFKLGGAVMGAWGRAGKWLGKKGYGLAEYGMERKYGRSPSSWWEARKLNWQRSREEAKTLAVAKSRGKHFEEAAKGSLARQRAEEEIFKPLGGTSRANVQRGLIEAIRRNDPHLLRGVVEAAQKEGMFPDQLDAFIGNEELQSRIRQMGARAGITFTDKDFTKEGLQTHDAKSRMLKAMFVKAPGDQDQEGLGIVNKMQEAATEGGDATAMDVFFNPVNGKYEAYDRSKKEDLDKISAWWKARFQSPDAWTSMPKFRKESFSTPGELRMILRQGWLSPAHLSNLHRLRASSVQELINSVDIIREEGAAGQPLLNEMVRRGWITEERALSPDVVRLSSGKNVKIEGLPDISSEIEQQVLRRARDYDPGDLKQLKMVVGANPNFSQAIKNNLDIHIDWSQKPITARAIIDMDADAAEQAAQKIASEIRDQIGSAIQAGVYVPEKVKQIIDSLPRSVKRDFPEKLKEALATSDATAVAGLSLKVKDIIEAHKKAVKKAKNDPVRYEMTFPEMLKKIIPSGKIAPAQYDQACQLVDSFEGGKSAPPRGRVQRRSRAEELAEETEGAMGATRPRGQSTPTTAPTTPPETPTPPPPPPAQPPAPGAGAAPTPPTAPETPPAPKGTPENPVIPGSNAPENQ